MILNVSDRVLLYSNNMNILNLVFRNPLNLAYNAINSLKTKQPLITVQQCLHRLVYLLPLNQYMHDSCSLGSRVLTNLFNANIAVPIITIAGKEKKHQKVFNKYHKVAVHREITHKMNFLYIWMFFQRPQSII